jgi:4-amino-4-deoxy-L-arabinose transferase-like glycosyltransferase
MVMGSIRRIFGGRYEMYVVPITAAGLVVCTAFLGTWVGGFLLGAAASVLLATSPPFVLQSLQPMSDVPTAFWWTLAAVLGSTRRLIYSVASAAAVVMAILTRPNLVPLAIPLVIFVLAARRRDENSYNWPGAIIVATGVLVGAALVAYLNTILFGAAGSSGYGAPRDLYQLGFAPANFARYTQWLLQTETVLVFAALAGLVALARNAFAGRWALFATAVFIIVPLSYLFYRPFDNWTYLRFLLPAYPLLFVALLSTANFKVFARRRGLRTAVIVMTTAIDFGAHMKFMLDNHVFKTKALEQKYLTVTDYIQRSLPANAVFISHQYTGSIRYYTDRRILRYDWLVPNRLDDAVQSLNTLGYKPFFLLEDWEEPVFQRRFLGDSALAKLDWYPSVQFPTNHVRIYDPAKRPAE